MDQRNETDVIEIGLFFRNKEVKYRGYQRAVVPCTALHWKQQKDGDYTNKRVILLPEISDFVPGRRASHFGVFRGGVRVAYEALTAPLPIDMEGVTPMFGINQMRLSWVIVEGHKPYLNTKFADLRLVDESDRAFLACGARLVYGPLTAEQQHAFLTLSKLEPLS